MSWVEEAKREQARRDARNLRYQRPIAQESPQYVCGMSVPPVMMANIATEVYRQWLKD